jgi:hypothetical protein
MHHHAYLTLHVLTNKIIFVKPILISLVWFYNKLSLSFFLFRIKTKTLLFAKCFKTCLQSSETSLLFFLLECCKKKEKNKQFSEEKKKGLRRRAAQQPIYSAAQSPPKPHLSSSSVRQRSERCHVAVASMGRPPCSAPPPYMPTSLQTLP